MQRIAVLVDAGYLLARGAEAVTGASTGRRGVILDEARAIDDLVEFAEAKANAAHSILRVYWYDGAGSQPTAEHIRLAELDNVKLRLGTINSFGEQKGVDSFIIADMIELARNRAAQDILLVSGDEDLRIGVQIAQTFGTRVHLLGIDIAGSRAQSPGLIREADSTTAWTAENVARFLSLRRAPEPLTPPAAEVVARTASESISTTPAAAAPDGAIARTSLEDAVASFFETLLPEDLEDIKTVWQASNSIPQPYDGRMLARTGTLLGRPLDIPEKREMRRIFGRLLQRADEGD